MDERVCRLPATGPRAPGKPKITEETLTGEAAQAALREASLRKIIPLHRRVVQQIMFCLQHITVRAFPSKGHERLLENSKIIVQELDRRLQEPERKFDDNRLRGELLPLLHEYFRLNRERGQLLEDSIKSGQEPAPEVEDAVREVTKRQWPIFQGICAILAEADQ